MADASESTTRVLDAQAADPMIGRQVRDFRVLERIGRGGMGSVYKAEHRLLREPRALKVMRAELFHAMPQAVERFEREARIAVKLRHPNLVLLYDFFVEDGDHFLVMEYVVGKSLATLMRERGALSVEETCRIGLQCCAGLAYAHEMGIVHRDLSPENVMITPSPSGPQVKIIDFGVARAAFATSDRPGSDEDATLTRVGQFIGKPRYASPEQAGSLRRGETLDQRSDLYTLGLMLFEMLTERFPFHSESDLGFLAKHAFEAPASPSRLRPDLSIPPGIERVILRCLEKDRARRFANARELGAALDWAWHSGDPRDAPFGRGDEPAAADGDATRPISLADYERADRRPALLAGAALLTLLGVATGGAAWWFSARDDARPRVVAAAEPAPGAPAPASPVPRLEPEPEPIPAPEVEAVPEPAPAPSTESERRAELAAAGIPAVEVPRVEKPAPAARPSPPREPVVERAKPHEPAPAPSFASADEMQRAFDEALAYESAHEPSAAIANWKRFRSRSPSRELDERAKRRITDLTLGNLRGYP
jgi:serine/threonine-protein kinase